MRAYHHLLLLLLLLLHPPSRDTPVSAALAVVREPTPPYRQNFGLRFESTAVHEQADGCVVAKQISGGYYVVLIRPSTDHL